ncbi:MAG: S8/S53 family peptidase [Aquabacterium sp.]|nr:S8/S53 family peptidase [Aquabacterium sp.]
MNNLLLTTDGRSITEVERKLRKYLPGLDTRLWPTGPTQAVLRAPLVQALETDYPSIGAGPLLKVIGITRIDAIDDETSATLVSLRDVDQLPPKLAPAVRAAADTYDWHLRKTRTPEAWALLGGPDAISWGAVKVGHIDTGYTQHPALGFAATTWLDLANARSFVPDPQAGEATLPSPELGGGLDNLQGLNGGHGTRIGATICGHAPNAAGGPFYGVAPKVPLVPARITDAVWINHRQVEFRDAVRHLIGTAGVQVINVSLGVFVSAIRKELRQAINEAYDAGVIMVCAAGNIVNPVVAPARLSRTLAVGGVTAADVPWSGSSYGPETDFSCYADDLRRANVKSGPKYNYAGGGDGTSYATAITSGAAALWLAHHGAALQAAYPQPWQRIEAFRTAARQTARVPDGWNPGAFGSGILDIEALLKAPLPPAATAPAPRA